MSWSTISTLQIYQSWKKPSVQARKVARIMEERTGSCYALSLSLKSKKLLKKSLRQGKNYLVSSDNTCGCIEAVCHNPSLSTSFKVVLSTSASRQMFSFIFFLLLETKSPFILSSLQTKIRSNWKPVTLIGCSFICNYVNMLAHKGQSNSLTNLFQFLLRKISTSFFPSVWKRKSWY